VGANPALDPAEPWRRLAATPSDHRWLGPDPNAAADHDLTSPPLAVASTGSFSFTFSHRYSFEFAGATFFDGGVIEISNNGGASWTDIGSFASPGYSGTFATDGGNPLGGLPGYAGLSPGYPTFSTVTVSLGTAFQGQTVRVRFRVGSDVSVGAPGWEVDNLSFNNITNLPFPALVADRHLCIDSDHDTVPDISDCAPFSSSLWAVPSEALNLTLDTAGSTLSWSPPAAPGGTSVLYDLLRAGNPIFSGGACVESAGSDLSASDPTSPAAILFYLVRSKNACGGNLGTGTGGAPRSGPACP
jgi:hypothetical protein